VEEQVFVVLRFDKSEAPVRQSFDCAFSHCIFLLIELIFGLKELYCYWVMKQGGGGRQEPLSKLTKVKPTGTVLCPRFDTLHSKEN
jgi:hypothetical protein